MHLQRNWTIYIAQDKHLDYNWCGTQTEIEVRMAALLDGYLALAAQDRSRWNMDSTWWYDVYQRQRGPAGVQRLIREMQRGMIGCAANVGVMLWGLLSTELAIDAFAYSLDVANVTGAPLDTALIEENPGMPWSVASVLAACGISYLGRGIYDLRARSYAGMREPYPLFWWEAPDGSKVLVHWDLYADTGSWGGYSEAFQLARIAGEKWDALAVQTQPDRNTDEVFRKRVEFINQTVARYTAYGDHYPVSSILLLGTGWDNWTITEDYAQFIRRFNAQSDGSVRLVDACYQDYFEAVVHEINEKDIGLPVLRGSFGITWEEWAAHLAGPTQVFRQASRLLNHAQAQASLDWVDGNNREEDWKALDQAVDACLRFAEHDFGGIDRKTAAISAGVRAGAAIEANTITRALSPVQNHPGVILSEESYEENLSFTWRGWGVQFDPDRCAVASLQDCDGYEWLPQGCDQALGSFLHTLYREIQLPDRIIPDRLLHSVDTRLAAVTCRRASNGVEIKTSSQDWGFSVGTRWFFHADHPWIDITYDLADGWTEAPQSVQFCFPFALHEPIYTYDMAGTILRAGAVKDGGDNLPGANPLLYAVQSYAQVTAPVGDIVRTAILLSPDTPLVQFGAGPENLGAADYGYSPAAIISMPMMNLTRNDWQFNQGGQERWQFRYRLVLDTHPSVESALNPLLPLREAQHFGIPPFLQVPESPPSFPQIANLDIQFAGGPVTALKRLGDGERLLLRLWNVLDKPVDGTALLPGGFTRAEITDALGRFQHKAVVKDGKVLFSVPRRGILTLTFTK